MLSILNNSSVNVKSLKQRSCENWTEFVKNLINITVKINDVCTRYINLQKEFDHSVYVWSEMMRYNVRYFSSYDPISEMTDYIYNSESSLCSPKFLEFKA